MLEHIKKMAKQIWEELADAQKYIKCADKWEGSIADMYYDLSVEELGHAERLHEEGTDYVNDHRNENNLGIIWDWETEKIKDMMRDVKVMQEMYRK